jgi:hypothetical protein
MNSSLLALNNTVAGGRGAGRRSSSSDVRVRGRGSWNHDDIIWGLLRTDLDNLAAGEAGFEDC